MVNRSNVKSVNRWAGIRTFQVPMPSDAVKAERIIAKIKSGAELSADDKRVITYILQRVINAREKVTGRRGRPKTSYASEIALDCVVKTKLLGKALAAHADVAKFWNVKEKTVKDAITDYGKSAQQRLDEILNERIGMTGLNIPRLGITKSTPLTREQVLLYVSDDLRSWFKKQTQSAIR